MQEFLLLSFIAIIKEEDMNMIYYLNSAYYRNWIRTSLYYPLYINIHFILLEIEIIMHTARISYKWNVK